MADVQIIGWQPGFNKVACTQLIQEIAGIGLADAKHITDRVLEGHAEVVALGDSATAQKFVADLDAIGARAKIVD